MARYEVYCETCERNVILRRKTFDHVYHEILCFIVISLFLIPLYLFLKYRKKPNTCPNCETEFDLDKIKRDSISLKNKNLLIKT